MVLGAAALPRRRPGVLADLVHSGLVREVLLVLAAAGFVGALAQISIPLSFTPVPITGQTLGVLVAGCGLGLRRASLAMALYVGAGFAGLPWFIAPHRAGWQGPSTGYLFGFVLAGAVCGYLAEHGGDRKVWRALPSMFVGEVAIYLVGVPWLALDLHQSLGWAISKGLTPFLIGDAIKAGIAAGLLPGAWRLAGRSRY